MARLKKSGKYIVTGGAGFIGSHLVAALLETQVEVIVLDNFSAGMRGNLPKHDMLTVLEVDISQEIDVHRYWQKLAGAAGVFHLAAEARIQPSIKAPRHTYNVNATGTLNVLEMMRRLEIKHIVYSASSSSYGLANKPPLNERMASQCLNPYAVTKLIGEELCKAYGNTYGITNTCLKYFNVYGPRSPIHLQAYSPVIGLFFKQALQDRQPLTVVGDGQQKRDFTYISDVVNANVFAMWDLHDKGQNALAKGRTINIGTGFNYTILETAQKVQEVLKDVCPDLTIKHIDARPGESRETQADISRARDYLGWTPWVSLDEGIGLLKPYYMELFNVRQ